MIGTEVVPDELKSLRWQVEANRFMNFTHNTIQETFVAFAAAAEEADLPRIRNVREIIAQLQEKSPIAADKA